MKQPKPWMIAGLLLPAALLLGAMGGQTPADPEFRRNAIRFSELQFVDGSGTLRTVAANQLLEVRLHQKPEGRLLLELYYVNKDYTLMNVPGFELIRRGTNTAEVNLITEGPLIFPNIP